MRIIFMGTPEFAVASLDALILNNFEVVAVITVPDRPAGRGQQIQESAVKKYAAGKGLPVLQPEKLKDGNFLEQLREFKADAQIVVAFRMLPEVVWNMPRLGTFNLHASLLPKYRGAAPINWAIINGETETGITTFKLQHEIDTGNILFQEKVAISADDTAGDLHDLLMSKGGELIVRTATALNTSSVTGVPLEFHPQNDTEASHAPKIFRETCKIDWRNNAGSIHDLIRGLSPYPSAFTWLQKDDEAMKTVKIFKARVSSAAHTKTNGSLLTDGKTYLEVFCGEGSLQILELQLEGKRKMSVTEFLKGTRDLENARFI